MDEESETGRRTSRRAFLGGAVLGGALAAAAPLLAGSLDEAADQAAAAAAAGGTDGAGGGAAPRPLSTAPAPAAIEAGFELAEATIGELQAALAAGRRTSRGLVEAYLARIAALDRRGPELRALLEVNPEALTIADALDAERRAQGAGGPPHGIPTPLTE